jgi:hypothetical protein
VKGYSTKEVRKLLGLTGVIPLKLTVVPLNLLTDSFVRNVVDVERRVVVLADPGIGGLV